MHALRLTLAASWLAAGTTLGAQVLLSRPFDADRAGALPAGFTLASFRREPGGPDRWLVRGQASQHYLLHAPTAGAGGYALAVIDGTTVADQSTTVRLRLAGGARAGGLVWRYRDPLNFYAAVLDLGDGDLALYRVSSGDLIRLEFEDDLELDVDAWHTLKVVHDEEEVTVSLGGIRVFQDTGRRNRAAGPGLVGFLATADSEVWFDDLRVEARRPRR